MKRLKLVKLPKVEWIKIITPPYINYELYVDGKSTSFNLEVEHIKRYWNSINPVLESCYLNTYPRSVSRYAVSLLKRIIF